MSPSEPDEQRPFGVYVHIPFCAKRCDYCAFATWTDRHHLHEQYVDACVAQLRRDQQAPATSVFVGGGTPSLIDPELLASLLRAIDTAPGAEITVECNPDNVTVDALQVLVDAGVNRVSIGVQSTAPHVLEALGRVHDRDAVERAVDAVRTVGLPTFNLDVIYGAAGESVADWESTLRDITRLSPPHVSAYGLTVEAGTPLAGQPHRHPDDDDQATKYTLAEEVLSATGLVNYEVSNWAAPGHECRHNFLYWRQGDYLGIGCAAHSHRAGRRWWNHRTPERYIDAVVNGQSPESGAEDLDEPTRAFEALELLLRTRDGVPRGALDLSDPALDGLVTLHGDRLTLTVAGRLLANEVAVRLRPAAANQ